jgi:hypothetical protein
MSVFSRLFDDSKEREIKKLLAETQKQVEKQYKPLGEIGRAIIRASTNCRDLSKNLISAPTEKERQEREVYIFYEFIYFYMHLTMRYAFVSLTGAQTKKLKDYLGPLISSIAIDSYFAHWPENLKQKMTGEFYDKLNAAELEYTECTQFDSSKQKKERLNEKLRALFIKLASNISELASDEKDIAIVLPVTEIAINEWEKMQMDSLIGEVNKAS